MWVCIGLLTVLILFILWLLHRLGSMVKEIMDSVIQLQKCVSGLQTIELQRLENEKRPHQD